METRTIPQRVDEILSLYEQYGNADYIGEPVSQIEHMCQCAQLAEEEGYGTDVILAAFFHDIGHLCEPVAETKQMDGYGVVDHEKLGAQYLLQLGFSEKISRLVASHVNAKRYLTFRFPEYYHKLSPASKETLAFQGGVMQEQEALAFEKDPLFSLYIRLRQWDEKAKKEQVPLPAMDKYRIMMEQHLSGSGESTEKMKTSLVVFDIAGTTVADKGNVNQAFRDAFLSEDIVVDETEVDKLMGYRKIEAIARMVVQYAPGVQGPAQSELIERIHNRFTEAMVAFYQTDHTLQPLPFAEEMFQLLRERGIKVALNTGFTRTITDAILYKLGWEDHPYINSVICSDEVPEGRPFPFMIGQLMQQLQVVNPAEVVKVGDTEVDIREGRNAGCGKVIAITTGAYNRAQLSVHHPDAIIDSLQELPALIF